MGRNKNSQKKNGREEANKDNTIGNERKVRQRLVSPPFLHGPGGTATKTDLARDRRGPQQPSDVLPCICRRAGELLRSSAASAVSGAPWATETRNKSDS